MCTQPNSPNYAGISKLQFNFLLDNLSAFIWVLMKNEISSQNVSRIHVKWHHDKKSLRMIFTHNNVWRVYYAPYPWMSWWRRRNISFTCVEMTMLMIQCVVILILLLILANYVRDKKSINWPYQHAHKLELFSVDDGN
jgi:hypothetical protein